MLLCVVASYFYTFHFNEVVNHWTILPTQTQFNLRPLTISMCLLKVCNKLANTLNHVHSFVNFTHKILHCFIIRSLMCLSMALGSGKGAARTVDHHPPPTEFFKANFYHFDLFNFPIEKN